MITGALKILLWGKEVGRLSWDAKRGLSYFEYSKDFLRDKIDAFPLIASIQAPMSRIPIWGDGEVKLYRKLPPFLADSLPDAWGNQVFECWRIENGIHNRDITPLDILSPAYDMTYIFNTGGFLPETNHCLMMRGKLSGQSKEDALAIAKENGIRKAEAIIRQVADAILRFRTFAVEYGVEERWIDAVETTLHSNLKAWGMTSDLQKAIGFMIDGMLYSNVHIGYNGE